MRFLVSLSILFFVACNSRDTGSKTVVNTDTSSTTVPVAESSDNSNPVPVDTAVPVTDTIPKPQPELSMADKAVLGRHSFTLQWIGWNNPGIMVIEKAKDDWYSVKGKQEGNNGYVLIDGKLRPVFENVEDAVMELEFDGRIESKASGINGNEACVRKGKQRFLSTKGRKYWRLQQMLNCDSTSTDYVDIYFK